MMEKEKKGTGFVVKDKRIFDEAGTPKQEDSFKAEDEPAKAAPETAVEEGSEFSGGDDGPGDDFLTEVNFYNFVLSLSTTALYHFGDFPDPATKVTARNLAAAKHTIDILSMLRGKTAGNLDENEKKLLEGILFELKMRYIRETTAK
ncbi:MAG: DUF1844 domain-containing protein [Smithellaceae bacterium]|nr:DUF1844 domain-containing protein [Smithellaceae bacterium]